MHSRRGFTLIEMLFVVIILAILATVALPAYLDSVRKARRVQGRVALMKLMQQQERFYTVHNRYVAFSSSSTEPEATQFQWYSGDTAMSSFYEISARACDDEMIRDCVVLSAQPGTLKVNMHFKDDICAELGLSSTGKKTARLPSCWE